MYEISAASPAEVRETLNRLGLLIAAACLLPKLLWGWQLAEVEQFVVPMVGGLLFFDVAYILALIAKLWLLGDEERR